MIRVDPSPILFIFVFLFDPSWSESIRVDPTRTGGPSWSGPTFVPAFLFMKNTITLDVWCLTPSVVWQ